MKKFSHPVLVTYIVAITLMFILALSAHGQKVIQRGNTFVEQVDSIKTVKKATKTEYVYIDKNGVSYIVYLSSNGKAFIIKTSKRTGKQYRQYLPEVTKRLSK